MRIIKSWTLKAIGAFIIVTYCQGLNQGLYTSVKYFLI